MGEVLRWRTNLLEDIEDLMYGPNVYVGSRRENQAKMALQIIRFFVQVCDKMHSISLQVYFYVLTSCRLRLQGS